MPNRPFAKPLLLIGMLLPVLASASCNTVPTVTGCSELARSVLTTPTEHAELQDSGDPALDWQLYGTAETGQLNKANDKALTGFNIISGCEKRDEAMKQQLERKWYWPF